MRSKRAEFSKRFEIWSESKFPYLACTFLLIALVACQGRALRPLSESEIRSYLHEAVSSRAVLDTLRAEAKVELLRQGRKVRFKSSILAKKPGLFFAQVRGFGFPTSVASIASGKIQFYTPSKSKYFVGSGTSGVQGLIGIGIAPSDWVGVLLGQIPEFPKERIEVFPKRDHWEVHLAGGSESTIISLYEQKGGAPWLREFRRLGDRAYTIRYENPTVIDDKLYASKITASAGREYVIFEFRDIEANRSLPNQHFHIDVPQGIRPESLDSTEFLLAQ